MLRDVASQRASGSARLGAEVVVHIDGLDDAEVVPVALRASERMNDLYQIDLLVDISHVREAKLRSAVLGRAIHIEVQRAADTPRLFHGVIARASLREYHDGHASYHFEIVPKLWLATKTVDSRVFSNLTVQEVVTTVLNDNGIVHAWSLLSRYARREYVVQWEESDYAFVTRLLAECGIFFSFFHPPDVESLRERLAVSLASQLGNELIGVAQQRGSEASLAGAGERVLGQAGTILSIAEVTSVGELLVLSDSAATYPVLAGAPELYFDATIEGGAMGRDESQIPHFHVSSAVEPTRATVRDYNHERAQPRPNGTVLATLPHGFRGALADGASVLADAGGGLLDEGLSQLDGGAAGMGSVAQATGFDPVAAFGQANEHHAFGVVTATHATMAPEVALARSAVALAGAVGEELLASTPLSGAADAVAGGARNLIGGAESVLEHYEHHGDYEEVEASFALARTRLEQLRAEHIECRGSSHCRSLMAGHMFALLGHGLAHLNRTYALVSVVHEIVADPDGPTYANAFTCIPSNVPARPHPPHRHYHQSLETGVVVGHEGQDIDTEHLGKVKVQFHWDRRKRHDEHSSCWIRVMQAWAGSGFGTQFVPRIGMEVLVSFIGGDMNRPVVVGCMPNLTNHPPFHLPEHKAQSGIRTRSTPGDAGGHNELMFDDTAGHEVVSLRAQRNHAVTVLQNETVNVGGNQDTVIGGNHDRHVSGNHETRIDANEALRIGRSRTSEVTESSTERIGGARTLTVGGHERIEVRGDRSITVRGSLNTIVGNDTEETASAMTLIDGHHQLAATETMSISADGTLMLICGESSIRMTPDEIVISAPNVRIRGRDDLVLSREEGSIQIGDETTIEATTVHVASEGASLTLDDDAWLNGARVLLNCDSDPADLDAETVAAGQGTVRFVVEPGDNEEGPFTLVISDASGARIERQTDANNTVELEGRPGAGFAVTEVRRGDTRVPHRVVTPDGEEEDG